MVPPAPESSPHDLAWLLHPVQPSQFFEQHWEQAPLHITNRPADYYRHLYGLADFDHTLLRARFRPEDLFVSRDDRKVPSESFLSEDGVPYMRRLYDLHKEGHTIYLYQLHRLHDGVRAFCRQIENEIQQESFPAVFLSPPRSHGSPAHYDVPNIFVLQLEGTKTWRLYPPIGEKPFRKQDIVAVPPGTLGEPALEVVLRPGDLLYFPRGFVHQPFTGEERSLHLTLGLTAKVWWDVFRVALDQMLQGHPRFREALPAGFLTRAADDEAKQQFRSLLQEFADSCDLESLLQALREPFFRDRPPLPDGHFSQLQHLDEIASDSLVERRDGVLAYVHWDEGSKVAISFSGGKVTAPPFVEPMLRDIAARQGPFRVNQIDCILGDAARLALIRQLVKSGLLRTVGPGVGKRAPEAPGSAG